MSAIWGRIDFNSNTCRVETMASEYKRKCKLDRIREIHYENTLFGSGLQIINDEDEYEDIDEEDEEDDIEEALRKQRK